METILLICCALLTCAYVASLSLIGAVARRTEFLKAQQEALENELEQYKKKTNTRLCELAQQGPEALVKRWNRRVKAT